MVHFRIDLDGRVFAACAPHLTVARHRGPQLAVNAVLISCPRCKDLVKAARAPKWSGTVKAGLPPRPLGLSRDRAHPVVDEGRHEGLLSAQEIPTMISPRMQALLSKVDAAEAAHFAGLRDSAQQDKEATRAKKLSVRRRPPWSGLLATPSAKPATKKARS
jgi:hypothetical protein